MEMADEEVKEENIVVVVIMLGQLGGGVVWNCRLLQSEDERDASKGKNNMDREVKQCQDYVDVASTEEPASARNVVVAC